jgi:hypothetical protein
MKSARIIALLGLVVLSASGCGKKPAVRVGPASSAAPASTPSDAASAPTTAACPPLPGKAAIERGIEKALQQIYGVDEAAQKVVIERVNASDCQHGTVTYRISGRNSPSETTPLVQSDDGGWSVTLYKKQYRL